MEEQSTTPIITIRDVTKNFGGLTAVNHVNLDIFPGEVTAIVGSNGAGKSTLIKMISGFYKPTSGEMYFKDQPLPVGDPFAVNQLGIETIYQDLALAELLDVPDNIFLGREHYKKRFGLRILDKDYMNTESEKILKKLKISVPFLNRPIRFLSGGQRQGVSISRAIYWNADVIIMDEPTAALGIKEKRQVKDLILDLRNRGVTIIVISHEMSDIFEISDKIVVLLQGRCVAVKEKHNTDIDEIARLIITGKSGEPLDNATEVPRTI
ncbi:ATP-binding cassette domain-containing protein [candidate division KSB3 bacterium]|uniref:ATP-binding cassette domain-containing protein n=1 Tax=candidate division KSB3 bacterium TaxID=2044937 RepID=A0A9D5K091_9BACT|nr:ATP-binding cassette domain-containing protein [candidate division KSB3 bacterium]MBD3327415.1 ATP-binding cassette domain-containing protein [candidate division KSB3 bacterium]